MNENTEKAGGTRYSKGKPKMTNSPFDGLWMVAEVSEYGAKKYAPLDWENGQSFSTLLSSGFRHFIKALRDPLSRDPESGLLHIAHCAWNVLALLSFISQGRETELDDITPYRGVSAKQLRAAEKVADYEGREVLDVLREK